MSDQGIRKRTDVAVEAIQKAKKLNDAMQARLKPGSDLWHDHEKIDDKLHDALGALGE